MDLLWAPPIALVMLCLISNLIIEPIKKKLIKTHGKLPQYIINIEIFIFLNILMWFFLSAVSLTRLWNSL